MAKVRLFLPHGQCVRCCATDEILPQFDRGCQADSCSELLGSWHAVLEELRMRSLQLRTDRYHCIARASLPAGVQPHRSAERETP